MRGGGPGWRWRRSGRALAVAVAVIASAVPAPAWPQAVALPTVAVVPTCVQQGPTARILVLGSRWTPGPVEILRNGVVIGTAAAGPRPVSQEAGGFSFTADVPATEGFVVTARQGKSASTVEVPVQSTCPPGITVRPTCLRATGPVQVSGSGFPPGVQVQVRVDPLGSAERPVQATNANDAGVFSVAVEVPFTGGTVPVLVTRPGTLGIANFPPVHFVAFVEPCPPDPTPDTTARTPDRAPEPTATTSTSVPGGSPGGVPPPEVPPVLVPTPGATAVATISPRTVRPGRCAVIVISAAPPALPVVARFADGPAVNGQTGADGRAVVSVCHPHDSGLAIGPVQVLLGIGPAAPAPAFTVLRVPPRPQPPLLQAGADGRRA